MSVPKIEINDIYTLTHVLQSSTFTEVEKINFIISNADSIKSIIQVTLGANMYNKIMSDKPLLRNHPLKNAMNKKVDEVLIGQVLNIKPSEISGAIQNITKAMETNYKTLPLMPDKLAAVKTYVYKHGTQEQLITFFNFELKKSVKIQNFYRQLKRNNFLFTQNF